MKILGVGTARTLAAAVAVAVGWGSPHTSGAATQKEERFALVVTNNRSQVKHRPNLQYADDDGARYVQVFRTVTATDRVTLLTRFDPASRRLFPELSRGVAPPTRAEVDRAVKRIERAVDQANKRGSRTVLYFVFAGHGHVQRGQGYLELEDGRLGPRDLERLILERVKADVVHLLLDSCNSFFVISPRKPGGKRWATPKDMTQGFSRRYPHVGVFLSTSAAGEVYEWSELQSGIFSHEVRSGLSGAADADGDGRVSYDELRAFVTVANDKIDNAQYRPKVFSRGPFKKGRATLFTHRWAQGTKIELGKGQRRLWIRDAQGSRLIDVHKEAGRGLSIVVPGDRRALVVQERRAADAGGDRPTLREYHVEENAHGQPRAPIVLAALTPRTVAAQARGPDAVFAQMFGRPYGPRAFREQLERADRNERLVFGISWRDEIRMRHYLSTLARTDRDDRRMAGVAIMGSGALIGVAGATFIGMLDNPGSDKQRGVLTAGVAMATVGTTLLGVGLYKFLAQSKGEQAYETFDREIRRPGAQRDVVIARTEAHLRELAQREVRRRNIATTIAFIAGGMYITSAVVTGVIDLRSDSIEVPGGIYATVGVAGSLLIGLGIAAQAMKTPLERMLDLYHEDPDLNISFGLAPRPGGAALGVSGTF